MPLRPSVPVTPALGDLQLAARFLAGLPRFARQRVDYDSALGILRARREQRVDRALSLVRAALARPGGVYPWLFRQAGCEYGDVRRLVERDGVEAAFDALYRAGIYLLTDEFKGRRPLRRGRELFANRPGQLLNPRCRFPVPAGTSGSTGRSLPMPIDLAFVRAYGVNSCLVLGARGGLDWVKAHWSAPGGGTLAKVLEFSSFGAPPARWFLQVDPRAPGLHPRYRWSERLLRWLSGPSGLPLPRPELATRDQPELVLTWLLAVLRSGRQPHLFTFVSSAVGLCRYAEERGFSLEGVHLTLVGEPMTPIRRATLRRSGADALPRYAANEFGTIGYGCLADRDSGDLHLMDDLQALIQTRADGRPDDPTPGTLLVSSLHPSAPFLLLNASLGDQAELDQRRCGCPLEALGWTSHLRNVRSDEKLTAGGLKYPDRDVIRVLEEVLPDRFGGGPGDYQLIEDELADGSPSLRLLVHPSVGELNPRALTGALLETLGSGSGIERLTALLWDSSGLVRVERRPPVAAASGKVLHIYRGRRPPATG